MSTVASATLASATPASGLSSSGSDPSSEQAANNTNIHAIRIRIDSTIAVDRLRPVNPKLARQSNPRRASWNLRCQHSFGENRDRCHLDTANACQPPGVSRVGLFGSTWCENRHCYRTRASECIGFGEAALVGEELLIEMFGTPTLDKATVLDALHQIHELCPARWAAVFVPLFQLHRFRAPKRRR